MADYIEQNEIAEGDEEPIDEEPIDEEPIDEEPIDEEPIDEEPIDEEPVEPPTPAVPAVVLVEDDEPDLETPDEDLEPVEMLSRDETRQAIYALLFVSDRPLSAPRIAEALGAIDAEIVVNLLDELETEIGKLPLPYSLKSIAGGYQLVTKAEHAPYVRRLFQIKKSKRLSRAILETLAIIAYRQPVTRADVESIRGVSVSHAFETLQEKRLIKVSGIAELPGRPKLYKTTDEFLIHFGMKSIKELPSIEELREMG